jgi:hypothetical protein
MHSVPSALTAFQHAVAQHVDQFTDQLVDRCRFVSTTTPTVPARPVRDATRGIDRFEPAVYPPFETLSLGPTLPDSRPHSVVVLNDGPSRYVDLSVRGAGVGTLTDERRFIDSSGVLRLALQQPDSYEIELAAPRRRRYSVGVEPEQFERGAGVTDVVVRPDGYVRYQPL